MAETKEKFTMFKCLTCGTARDFWYDKKGGCSDKDCKYEDYHYDCEEDDIEREF